LRNLKKLGHFFSMALVLMCASRGAWACACGCGVFEVGTSSMFPMREGSMAFFEYDYQNQLRNWRGDSPVSADDNEDKRIRSSFFTLGYERMFNRSWGVMGEFPVVNRFFKTTDEDSGEIASFTHTAVGDIRLKGIYSGFSEDMSTGLTFGLRLPTGDDRDDHFDPDVEIGSGSTDLLLGAYHLSALAGGWEMFANAELDLPVLHDEGYQPGTEMDGAWGAAYSRWAIGPVKISPLAQLVGSHRWSDNGFAADAPNTGYSRVLVAPGIEFGAGPVRLYVDVGFPVYQHTTGNQLVASQYYKLNVSYRF
jgi:hypothetical protein